MTPRLFGLSLVVRDQRVELVDQRRHLARQALLRDVLRLARSHVDDRQAQLAQRPQPVKRLQRRHHEKAEAERSQIFDRGARLDTGKPGTGLGLAIVRDVAEIYGGSVTLDESEDLGGLLARLRLPAVV